MKMPWATSPPAPEPMVVERVADKTGSHIEPPFDRSWSEFDELRWCAAVTTCDSGLPVSVEHTRCSGYGPGPHYDVVIGGSSSSGPYLFREARYILSGITFGAQAVRREQAR